MPELPEVETTVLALRPKVLAQRLSAVEVLDPKLGHVPKTLVLPAPVKELNRRGKYILFDLGAKKLVLHLRLSGRLFWAEKREAPPHTRMVLCFPLGYVFFCDPRRLGTVEVQEEFAEPLGPDALGDLSFLGQALGESRVPIKVWLLDQHNIAGLGNIYASEALFLAGIDPRRPAFSLTSKEVVHLADAIHQVLEEALAKRGTTLVDQTFRTPEGEAGDYEPWIYGREGLPCQKCATPIARIELGGRGTFFCPHCQR